ncbi:MAG: dCTP deaminase [Chloroflexota bacterium]|nr:dCTP deaminase [Chloroflexota bacterium]
MLLSDKRISEEIEHGNIIIEPFEQRQLGTNSYDVRLGTYYFTPNHNMVEVNFTDEHDAQEFWLGPFYADDGVIRIRPGDTILAHTEEIVGGRNGFTTSMRSRSSIGRSCLSVCKCAGVGDVGYISRWTMEITNHSHAIAVLPVGLRVAQILFYEVGETLHEYKGKYGSWQDWSPRDMLPKLYRDYDLPHVGAKRVIGRNGHDTRRQQDVRQEA